MIENKKVKDKIVDLISRNDMQIYELNCMKAELVQMNKELRGLLK